jgi:DNA-binding NtrC family response regulator
VLCSYEWPGNVRELVNCVRYVASLSPGDVIGVLDLPQRIRKQAGISPQASLVSPGAGSAVGSYSAPAIRYDLGYKKSKRLWMEVFEVAYIGNLLNQNDGNISHAARAAGIDRKSIQRLMKRNAMGTEGGLEDEDGDDL